MANVIVRRGTLPVLTHRQTNIPRVFGRIGLYATILLGAFIVALPFLWMLSTSLSPNSQIALYNIQWIPHPVTPQNYPLALKDIPFIQFTKNTLTITVFNMLGTMLSSYLVA